MPLKNTRDRWGSVSKLLHWTTLLLLVWIGWLGLTMGDLPNGPGKIATYALHKSIGITILTLAAIRIAWRLYAGAPDPIPGSPRWQERIASLTHLALYGLLLAMPLSGWILNSASGFPLQWFGLFNLPAITGKDHELHELAEYIHEWLFWAMATLVVLHASAAFYHHLFQRDATLARMLPGSRIARRIHPRRRPMRKTLMLILALSLRARVGGRLRASNGVQPGVRRHVPGRSLHGAVPRLRHHLPLRSEAVGRIEAGGRASRWRTRRHQTRTTTASCAAHRSSTAARFPRATYSATTFRALGGNRYAADGVLDPARHQQAGGAGIHLDAPARRRCSRARPR
jgi:cytochrome b561